MTITLPSSTGFTSTTANIGRMTNKGHELSLILRPIKDLIKGLSWDINLLYSQNRNNVVKITDEIDELTIGGLGNMTLVAKEGMPFGTFKATDYTRNDAGQIIVDGSGYPISNTTQDYFGSYQPDYLASIGTSIGYKGFSFSGLLDIKQGGTFYSWTKDQGTFNGTGINTVEFGREPFVYPNSVTESGEANTTEITAQGLFTTRGVIPSSYYLVDASYIKLRELTLNYALPKSIVSKIKMTSANLGIFANNIKFWLPAENTFADPEVNGANQTGNYIGIETSQVPPSRSLGFKLGFTF